MHPSLSDVITTSVCESALCSREIESGWIIIIVLHILQLEGFVLPLLNLGVQRLPNFLVINTHSIESFCALSNSFKMHVVLLLYYYLKVLFNLRQELVLQIIQWYQVEKIGYESHREITCLFLIFGHIQESIQFDKSLINICPELIHSFL